MKTLLNIALSIFLLALSLEEYTNVKVGKSVDQTVEEYVFTDLDDLRLVAEVNSESILSTPFFRINITQEGGGSFVRLIPGVHKNHNVSVKENSYLSSHEYIASAAKHSSTLYIHLIHCLRI